MHAGQASGYRGPSFRALLAQRRERGQLKARPGLARCRTRSWKELQARCPRLAPLPRHLRGAPNRLDGTAAKFLESSVLFPSVLARLRRGAAWSPNFGAPGLMPHLILLPPARETWTTSLLRPAPKDRFSHTGAQRWKHETVSVAGAAPGAGGGEGEERGITKAHTLNISRHFPPEFPGCNPLPPQRLRDQGGRGSLRCRRREVDPDFSLHHLGIPAPPNGASPSRPSVGKINYPIGFLHSPLTISSSLSTSASMLNSWHSWDRGGA